MRRILLALPICALLAGIGFLHGVITDRWSPPPSERGMGQAASNVPLAIGDWRGEPLARENESDQRTVVVNRTYRHRMTGNWVLTSVTSGRPGIVSVHNPEHCYLGSGYKVVDTIRADSLELPSGESARFWTGHFQKKKATGIESIRIYWGWTADGPWQAPTYPRLLFAMKPRLHKLYMIHPVATHDEKEDVQPYREFMTAYVAALIQSLKD